MAIAIVRSELNAAGLRQAAGRSRDANAARRMLALALVMEGASRTEAARCCGMDRQSLRDWVHRYNAEGLEGLADRHRTGRPSLLAAEQQAELEGIIAAGPDPAVDGVVRWRCVDLQRVTLERFEVEIAERTMAKLVHKLGFSRLTPRPRHPKSDVAAQEAYKKLRCPGEGAAARSRAGQAHRDMVPGRGAGRSEGNADPGLGQARITPSRAARPAPWLGPSTGSGGCSGRFARHAGSARGLSCR